MGPTRAFRRAAGNLRRHRGRSVLLAGGVAVGVGMLVFLLAFVAGTRSALLDRIVSSMPITHVTVVPRSISLSILKLDSPFSTLDEAAVERIERVEGIERVMPMAALGIPAQLRATFFGQGFVTDTGVFGIDRRLVAEALPDDVTFGGPFADGSIPAVISEDLIDMYNTGFARANDLPRLTPQVLRDQDARLYLGTSSFRRGGGPQRIVEIRLVGVSDRVPLVGVSLPLQIVEAWNRDLAGADRPRYVQLTVVAAQAQEVDRVAERIESMGYTVSTGRELGRRIRMLTDLLGAAFGLIGTVVLAVAGLGIANALLLSVVERRHEIGVFRSVGATRADVRLLFLCEAGLIGVVGGTIGVALAFAASRLADAGLDRVLPSLPLLPESFFALSWPILATGFTLGVLVSVVAAVPPAHRAARLDPAQVLKSG